MRAQALWSVQEARSACVACAATVAGRVRVPQGWLAEGSARGAVGFALRVAVEGWDEIHWSILRL